MRRKRITACMILLLMAAALTGFMIYTSYVKEQQQDKRGTLVRVCAQAKEVAGL